MPNLQIPHLVLTVKDFQKSRSFYKAIFVDFLGCEVKIDTNDFFYFRINSSDQSIGISTENQEFKQDKFNRYRVGLHHFAIELETKKLVEDTFDFVKKLGYKILEEPTYYPEYDKNYFAFYYLDPDNIKHEFVTFEKTYD
jgi:glyoxylase I family protein